MIAAVLIDEMAKQRRAQLKPAWEQEAAAVYQEHLDQLEDFYFARGQQMLVGLRQWTQGRANGPPVEDRFPHLLRDDK